QVILVLGFGFPEITGRRDFGDRLARPQAGRVDVGDGVQCDALLLGRGVVDRRAVGRTQVIALAVARARVVDLEEEFQQVAIADARGIEHDLDCLGMGAVVAVGGIAHFAAAVTHARTDDTVHAAQQILHAPEASAGEDRALQSRHFVAHRTSSTWSRYAP